MEFTNKINIDFLQICVAITLCAATQLELSWVRVGPAESFSLQVLKIFFFVSKHETDGLFNKKQTIKVRVNQNKSKPS